MSTNDQNEGRGGGQGQAAAPAQQQQSEGGAERGGGDRHGRNRRRGRQPARAPQSQGQPRRGGESSLNVDELRELTELFSEHGLTDFEFENADIRIRLSRNPAPSAAPAPGTFQNEGGFHTVTPHAAMQAAAPPPAPAPAAPQAAAQPAAAPEPPPAEDLYIITSPIPGTFYRAPAPNADSFVNVGSAVKLGTVVCIIEAMKLMNEIESDADGTVEKIYVENGQPVEYGQPLFGIKK